MVYLTYDEYKECGGTMAQADFTLAEFKAQKRIDYLTDSRVKAMASVPEAVKLCIMVIMDMESKVGAEAQVSNPVVTSFNTDGYSESYGKAMGADEADRAMNKVVREYLNGEVDDYGVPLLYRGLNAPQYFMLDGGGGGGLSERTDTLGSVKTAIADLQDDVEDLQNALTYPKTETE